MLVGLDIKLVVKVVEHVDHVQWVAGGRDAGELHDVTEQNGHLVKLLCKIEILANKTK